MVTIRCCPGHLVLVALHFLFGVVMSVSIPYRECQKQRLPQLCITMGIDSIVISLQEKWKYSCTHQKMDAMHFEKMVVINKSCLLKVFRWVTGE